MRQIVSNNTMAKGVLRVHSTLKHGLVTLLVLGIPSKLSPLYERKREGDRHSIEFWLSSQSQLKH